MDKQVYEIKPGSTADEIGEQVAMILSTPSIVVDEIHIVRGKIESIVWLPDREPPYGELPDRVAESMEDLLASIELSDIDDHPCDINLDSLSTVASMLIQCRVESKGAIAWVAGKVERLCRWLGIAAAPSRFMDLPVYESEVIPDDKLLLLCGKSSRMNPLLSDYAITVTLEDTEDAEV